MLRKKAVIVTLATLLGWLFLTPEAAESRRRKRRRKGPKAAKRCPTPKRGGHLLPKTLRPLQQRSYHVQVVGRTAYVATTVGLRIVNIRRPACPYHHGTLTVPGTVNGLWVQGARAYLAAGPHGVVVVDVNDPRQPKQLQRLNTPGAANAVTVDGDHLYVADGSFGVAIYDLKSPTRRLLKKVETGCYTRDVRVLGRTVYVACSRGGLLSFESAAAGATKPGWPKPLARMPLAGDLRNLALGPGRTLYVAAGEAGVHILDARRAAALKLVSTIKVSDFAHGVSAWGALTAIADGEAGVHLYNCRKRQAPVRIATHRPKPVRAANKVLLQRGRLYVAWDHAGLHILKASAKRLTPKGIFGPAKKRK